MSGIFWKNKWWAEKKEIQEEKKTDEEEERPDFSTAIDKKVENSKVSMTTLLIILEIANK